MRAFEEFFEEAEFVHQLQSGRMDGVAAEVAEEIGVFFEDLDFDAGTGEEETEHHAGGTAADYAATGLGKIGWHGLIFLDGGPEEKGNMSRRGRSADIEGCLHARCSVRAQPRLQRAGMSGSAS